MDRNETIADIVAELRKDAEHVEDEIHDDDMWSNTEAAFIYRDIADRIEAAVAAFIYRDIADRIEAAVKREELRWAKANGELAHMLDCEKAQGGNAAKLREALNRLREWALLDLNENAIGMEERNYRNLVDGIIEIATAALAAPPRNCDRFATEEDAYKAWQASRGWTPDAEERGGYGAAWAYAKWLFAPAAQEGGQP